MNYYKPDDGFEMRELSDAQHEEMLDCRRAANRYMWLSFVILGFMVFMLVKHRWGFALAFWIMSNISSMFASYYHSQEKKVIDE